MSDDFLTCITKGFGGVCNTWHVLTLPMTPTRCAHFHSFGPCLELLSVCNLHQTEIKTSCECEFPSTTWPLNGCSRSRKRGVEGSVSHLNFPKRLQTDSSIVLWKSGQAFWLNGSFGTILTTQANLSKFSVLPIPKANQHNIRYIFSNYRCFWRNCTRVKPHSI